MDNETTNGNGSKPRFDEREAILNAKAEEIVNNITSGRQMWLDRLTRGLDPRRNINNECGYPESGAVDAWKYQELYDREPIAGRVVEVMSKQSWQVQPRVYETEKGDEPTAFEKAWDGLAKQLRGRSWYKDEEGSPVWEYLLRADILSGIGHYGVIFIGLNDGVPDLSLPARGVEEQNSDPTPITEMGAAELQKKGIRPPTPDPLRNTNGGGRYRLTTNADEAKGRKITMLRALPETQCQVVQWEQNATSPRYGQPVMYLMYFADPQSETLSLGQPIAGRMVHWTRCLHVADTWHHASASEIIAAPRIKPVLNAVLDVVKIRGAGAEGYWQAAFNLVSFETNPQLGADVTINKTEMKDLFERIQNGLQRWFYTNGFVAKSIAPVITDPTPHIAIQLEAICIKLEMPIRIFKGSERGELASSQDDSSWNDRVQERQLYYNSPRIVIPFVDRLIMLGVLPEPTEVEEKEVVDEAAQKEQDDAAQGAEDQADTGAKPPAKPPQTARPAFGGKKPSGVYNSRRTYTRRRVVSRAVYNAMVANDFPNMREVGSGPPLSQDDNADASTDPTQSDDPGDVTIEEEVDVPTKVIKTDAGYCIEWPDITSMSALDKATVFNTKMTGLSTAVSGGVAQLIGEHKILTEYGMDDEEAKASLEEGAQAAEQQMGADQQLMDEHGFEPAAPPGMVNPDERDMQHEVELAKAKNPGFGPGGGGGGKPPFPPKPSLNRSVEEDEDFIANWCNQYGGDTCLEEGMGEGKYKGAGTKDDPVKCGDDIKAAAKLIADGRHVQLNQPEQVSTLIDKFEKIIARAKEAGQQAPKLDLCKVSVPGTNLFCQDNIGVPRINMPQMRGQPVPGSYADTKERVNKAGKVDISREFVEHLKDKGIGVAQTDIRASFLRASQNEIDGARVVELMNAADKGKDLRERPIFVTKDNYIVDGHHHWAALVGRGLARDKDYKVPVYRLNTDIGTALTMANDFARDKGIAPKTVGTANALIENWCNQYGGDTCKDGAKNEATKERVADARGKAKNADKGKLKERVKKETKGQRDKRVAEFDKWIKEGGPSGGKPDEKFADFDKVHEQLKDERQKQKEQDAMERSSKSVFRRAWDALVGNTQQEDEDGVASAIDDLIATAEEQLGRDLTDDEIDQIVEEFTAP